MAETLGSLCDKLTIVKLKQWHTEDPTLTSSLEAQAHRLAAEIDDFTRRALAGEVPRTELTFAANKVYKREGNEVAPVSGGIGELFAELARVNCALWHEQEKVYEFEKVPAGNKDAVVKQLALFNLQRNQCIDGIDRSLVALADAALGGTQSRK
ncbi:MAG: hypothetical protein JWN94_2370 [Betaproteobacteria bacterium]|nr:hypothetical protein [Betaproteobacteria bacterium]